MTLALLLLLLLSEACSVTGQIFFKHGMGHDAQVAELKRRALSISAGVVAMTVGFFLWIGLLHRFELSYLYPFEGLDRIFLVVAAYIFLREKMTVRLWVGMVFIVSGTFLVGMS